MFIAGKSVTPIDFAGLRIFDYTAGHDLNASLAVVEVPPGARVCRVRSYIAFG